jgi:hypothetical protein
MSTGGTAGASRLERIARLSWAVGIVGLAICAVVLFRDRGASPLQVLEAYLTAWWFTLGLSLGSLATMMVHHLTGGSWGRHVRPPMEAAARTLPLVALLFVPLLFGLHALYSWTEPGASIGDPSIRDLVQKKHWYLNEPFFFVRAGVYFTVWMALAARFGRAWVSERHATPETTGGRTKLWSVIGLIAYAITITFAAIDWIMSLVPQWYSTTFGLLTGVGQSLSGFAFGIFAASLLPYLRRGAEHASKQEFNDLGNLLLMFVMLWAYLAFTEYLVIWAEDLRHENAWHVPRVETSWRWVGLFLIVFQFAAPFFVLLFREAKRRAGIMLALGAGLLCVHFIDSIWVVSPSLHPHGIELHWIELAALGGVGGLWLANVSRLLGRDGAVPRAQPFPDRELEHG